MLYQDKLKTINFHPEGGAYISYARYIALLARGAVEIQATSSNQNWQEKDWVREAEKGFELVIFEDPQKAWWQRLLIRVPEFALVHHSKTSVLLVRNPIWPIRRVLLILLGIKEDESIVNWAIRLAQPSSATVILIALTPPVPAMYSQLAIRNQDWATVMDTDTDLGRSMRMASQCLIDAGVNFEPKVRPEIWGWPLPMELLRWDCDLIGIADPGKTRFQQWLEGDPVRSLLVHSRRPVLISKSMIQ